MKISLVLPNQLFFTLPDEIRANKIYLLEENSYFKKYNYNIQKLIFLRHAILEYCKHLDSIDLQYEYISAKDPRSDLAKLFDFFQSEGVTDLTIIDPVDSGLFADFKRHALDNSIHLVTVSNASFLNNCITEDAFFRSDKKIFRHADFYKKQRIKHNILIDSDLPRGGKWSFDSDNRKSYPKSKKVPLIHHPSGILFQRAADEINEEFPKNIGSLPSAQLYPSNHIEAQEWFEDFLNERFKEFGSYEDAILKDELFINHSVISPMLNCGLLTPAYVIKKTLEFSEDNEIPINSLEGFIRQIIGWREFIRGMYEIREKEFRTSNFWGFNEPMPEAFYTAQTGILPVDDSIRKVLKFGYNHHIERLMILGNFMMLCEIKPSSVYQWFMEMYIDAYEWVMVPNVFGMSQFSDGGSFATKPYISSSNYVLKMSNYSKGEWCPTWDALFWRFMDKNRLVMKKNPRVNMLINNFDKKDPSDKNRILGIAEDYLKTIRS